MYDLFESITSIIQFKKNAMNACYAACLKLAFFSLPSETLNSSSLELAILMLMLQTF